MVNKYCFRNSLVKQLLALRSAHRCRRPYEHASELNRHVSMSSVCVTFMSYPSSFKRSTTQPDGRKDGRTSSDFNRRAISSVQRAGQLSVRSVATLPGKFCMSATTASTTKQIDSINQLSSVGGQLSVTWRDEQVLCSQSRDGAVCKECRIVASLASSSENDSSP